MIAEVIFHERRDEIIAMIVTVVPPQFERHTAFLAGCLKQVRMQFLLQERICQPLIDKNLIRRRALKLTNNFCRIVFSPARLVATQVIAKGFLPPGTIDRAAYRRKCGNGLGEIGGPGAGA